ncbi:MAG: alpha-2-macroglobulin family protein [Kofleriaceae bacterium]
MTRKSTTKSTTNLLLGLLVIASCGRDKADGYSETRTYATSGEPAPPPVEEDPWDGEDESGGTGTAMALEEGKMGKKESDRAEGQYKMKQDSSRAQAIDDAKTAGNLGSEGEMAGGFGFGQSNAGPGGGGTGWGTIGTGRYPTTGKGAGTGSGYGVGSGRGGMRGRGGGGGGGDSEDVVRSWFPETFLFEPLVVTDDAGNATVPVRVPDRLTSWRVLALAHSREGAQGGATTQFIGTLPTYVDLVVPKFLVIGDEVKLPIQMINTTESPVTSQLTLDVKNGALGAGGGTKTIPAQSGVVEYATLKAEKAGTITVFGNLAGSDAVQRTIEVRPSGRPETVMRTGTLAEPRTLTIDGPVDSDPATDRVRLLVYPGALSLLRAELGVSTLRAGVAEDAYALLLAGKAEKLLGALGDKADPEAIRTLSIITGQRAIRAGRNLDVDRATLLVEAALAHPQNPVLARLGERAAAFLAKSQRPDGTFAGGQGWTLQRVLVATADATRAVASAHLTTTERQRAQGVAMRAAGAFERNSEQVQDAYTAAAILASGGAKGAFADKLRERVHAGIKAEVDGSKYLDVPAGVVRSDGMVPTRVQATALAVLALQGDAKAPMADLGATLLGSYSPERGWGDGHANLACMQAVVELFKTPVPAGVKISLLMDGVLVTEGTLDREALREVLTLEAPAPATGLAGSHTWKIVAEPPVPGLGYSLALKGYVPWKKQTTEQGLEMEVTGATMTAQVGKPTELTLVATAPSGSEVKIVQALPAGVQVDTASLDALVESGSVTKFEAAEGKLELTMPPLDPGQLHTVKYKVIPTLAGTLRSAASTISMGATKFSVPPIQWTVKQ